MLRVASTMRLAAVSAVAAPRVLPTVANAVRTAAGRRGLLTKDGKVAGRVHSVESFSTIDGVGIRFMIFMQGCPLRCLFCSNPDTWNANEGGQVVTVEDMVKRIKKCANYLKASGGGVTISGGEPLLQPEFVSGVFKAVQEMGLNTAVDTTGVASRRAIDMVLPHTDMALWCSKASSRELYEKVTQRDHYDKSRDFAGQLGKHNVEVSLRYVLIPGITDGEENLKKLVKFASNLPTLRWIELLPYHTLGVNKYQELGVPYPLEDQRTNTREEVRRAIDILQEGGLKVLCV